MGIDIESPRENEMLVSSIWLFSLSDEVFFGSRKHQSSNRLVLTSFGFVNGFSTELMAEKFLCPIGSAQRSSWPLLDRKWFTNKQETRKDPQKGATTVA